jgi:hypothetical protein
MSKEVTGKDKSSRKDKASGKDETCGKHDPSETSLSRSQSCVKPETTVVIIENGSMTEKVIEESPEKGTENEGPEKGPNSGETSKTKDKISPEASFLWLDRAYAKRMVVATRPRVKRRNRSR